MENFRKICMLTTAIICTVILICGCVQNNVENASKVSATDMPEYSEASTATLPTTVPTTTVTTTTTSTTTTTTTTTTAALQLETDSKDIYCRDIVTLNVVYGKAVKWTSSDSSVASVDKKGEVTTKKAGTAVITAYDRDGNSARCTINCLKVAYITIDDWPNENTGAILDILAEYDVKATFFTCGTKKYDHIYKRIVEEGHTLANHTYSHDSSFYYDFDTFFKEVRKQEKHIESFTGEDALKIFRFPKGSKGKCYRINGDAFAKKMRSKGYHLFDWTSTLGDTSSTATPESCIANVKKYTNGDREIILMHNKKHSAEALPAIIEYLLEKGYTLAPITMSTQPYSFV